MSRRMALSLLACGALAGAGCGRALGAASPAQLCAAPDTVARLAHAAFEQAAAQALTSDQSDALARIGEQARAELVHPVVEGHDRDSGLTTCAARLVLTLPPGVRTAAPVGGPVRYVAQPGANGPSAIVTAAGLERIASALAGADLSAWAATHGPAKPVVIDDASAESAPPAAPAPPAPPALAARAPRPAPVAPATRRFAARDRAPVVPPAPPSPPPVASSPARAYAAAPEAAEAAPVRVFVHIAEPGQRAGADDLRARLRDLDVGGRSVATPPVRFVRALPRWTEVRCLRRADCAAAHEVARPGSVEVGCARGMGGRGIRGAWDRGRRARTSRFHRASWAWRA